MSPLSARAEQVGVLMFSESESRRVCSVTIVSVDTYCVGPMGGGGCLGHATILR